MKKGTTIIALAALAGIAVYDIGFRKDGGGGVAGAGSDLDRSVELSEVTRSRAPLSRGEIVERLPGTIPQVGGAGLSPEQRGQFEIFEKLGALEGEAAVDYVFAKYGKGASTYLPMTFAMRGWMETDLEAGLAAFKGFLKNGRADFAFSVSSGGPFGDSSGGLFQWKGEGFHSGIT
ncbi:hypothetical protein N9230_00905 [Akkermansiaceae bacterium]|nr:hypothetical protein [Akkermansiaceae bacterium]